MGALPRENAKGHETRGVQSLPLRRLGISRKLIAHCSQVSWDALWRALADHWIHFVESVSAISNASAAQEESFGGPKTPAVSQISAMAQQLVLITGVPKHIASAAGMPNDSQVLRRLNTLLVA